MQELKNIISLYEKNVDKDKNQTDKLLRQMTKVDTAVD